jgi:hypothetical protein
MTELEAEQARDEWMRVNNQEAHIKRIEEQTEMFVALHETMKYDGKLMNRPKTPFSINFSKRLPELDDPFLLVFRNKNNEYKYFIEQKFDSRKFEPERLIYHYNSDFNTRYEIKNWSPLPMISDDI